MQRRALDQADRREIVLARKPVRAVDTQDIALNLDRNDLPAALSACPCQKTPSGAQFERELALNGWPAQAPHTLSSHTHIALPSRSSICGARGCSDQGIRFVPQIGREPGKVEMVVAGNHIVVHGLSLPSIVYLSALMRGGVGNVNAFPTSKLGRALDVRRRSTASPIKSPGECYSLEKIRTASKTHLTTGYSNRRRGKTLAESATIDADCPVCGELLILAERDDGVQTC